jgi:hypothetical protein
VAERPAHGAKSSPICPKGAVVEIKRKIVEEKEGKKGKRWPAGHKSLARRSHLTSTQLPLSLFTTSCSSHAHSTNQKIKSKANSFHVFQSSIYFFLKFLDFMIYNDAINKYVVGKE